MVSWYEEGVSVLSANVTPLEVSILDEAYDFPVPVAQLIQLTVWVFVDDGEQRRTREDPASRGSAHGVVTSLLGRGLVELVRDDGVGPVEAIPMAEWAPLLEDDATWRQVPRSPICVFTTQAGDVVLETEAKQWSR
jgi:hypothetical protein